VIKERIMRRAGHVPQMEERRNAYKVLVGQLGRRKHRGRMILK
jgi:hypothetical protein